MDAYLIWVWSSKLTEQGPDSSERELETVVRHHVEEGKEPWSLQEQEVLRIPVSSL